MQSIIEQVNKLPSAQQQMVADFIEFLSKITAFIFAYAVTNPGVNALRTPIYDEMVNIVFGKKITFQNHRFQENVARSAFENYIFTNQRNVTRSILTWYAYTFKQQTLLDLDDTFHIEHIYAKKRHHLTPNELKDENNLESLGNKILLESSINISASDYRFEDKKKIYTGIQRRGRNKEPSKVYEISELIQYDDFTESEITIRNKKIIDCFFDYLRAENLFR